MFAAGCVKLRQYRVVRLYAGAEHCIDVQGCLAATFETKLVRGEQNPRGMPDNFSDKYLEIYSDIAGDSTTHLLK
jgi:hypothetical protein